MPSVSKCAHFQLASLLLICTKSILAESARCYAGLAGRSYGSSLFVQNAPRLQALAAPLATTFNSYSLSMVAIPMNIRVTVTIHAVLS